MKVLTKVCLLIMIVSVYACKKKSDLTTTNTVNTDLMGQWMLTANFMSNGSPGQWVPVPAKVNPDYIRFEPNGKLSGNVYSTYTTYKIKDSVMLEFSKPDKTIQNFAYKIIGNELTLNFAGPIYCFEGCGTRFRMLQPN